MNPDKWKKTKGCGNFNRQMKQTLKSILEDDRSTDDDEVVQNQCVHNLDNVIEWHEKIVQEVDSGNASSSDDKNDDSAKDKSKEEDGESTYESDDGEIFYDSVDDFSEDDVINDNYYDDSNNLDKKTTQYEDIIQFRSACRAWAIENNITHRALNDLAKLLNSIIPNLLPNDARTLMKTPRSIETVSLAPGEYWHNGLIESLKKILESSTEQLRLISLCFNIDGLPVGKSSAKHFWPILCRIIEKPDVKPFIVGIYAGPSKPSDVNEYLKPFVEEMKRLLENGIEIKNCKVDVTVRCFICDSPARAMIKGVQSYNGKHGCNKCTIVGVYSHVSGTTTFQEIDCPSRNDEDFRKKLYGKHHKMDSALLSLPIDFVRTFPVSDSMHLIDLGVMKRLLIGWRDGNFGKKDTKWRANDISKVNSFLDTCETPTEIHRAVRNLKDLGHWKASEFRTFLMYLSIVILQDVLNTDAMKHFLSLFCAITICSNEKYFNFLPLAEDLLKYFVKNYKLFYGVDYMFSNVHNLTHIVEEVRLFGKLQDFNAYPFENKLFTIKKLLRHGNKPLSQVAKRLGESGDLELHSIAKNDKDFPYVKKNGKTKKLVLHCKDFILSEKKTDRHFLTKNAEIMEITRIKMKDMKISLRCNKIIDKKEVFKYPIKSSYLNIYKYKLTSNVSKCWCSPENIKCKLVATDLNSERYVLPLLHTV